MNKILNFSFIGGDLRQIQVMNMLSQNGHHISVFGFTDCENDLCIHNFHKCKTLQETAQNADIVVLPLPYTADGETIKTPFYDEKIYIENVVSALNEKQILFVGKIDNKIKKLCEQANVQCVDYFDREELTVLNAIPTAEGAISIAMNETAFTIHDSNCLVMGFGRIGKILAKMLYGLGADVSVEARRVQDLAWISAYGYKPIDLHCLEYEIENYDIVFNTIPFPVLDFKLLSKLKKDCLVIDLASKPGGVDFDVAKRLGINVIWALSLPLEVTRWKARNCAVYGYTIMKLGLNFRQYFHLDCFCKLVMI